MMKLLLDYCNATGAILIAEGIETVQELECLHSLGVHYGQGFSLGKLERAFGNISAESEEILERLNGRKNILFWIYQANKPFIFYIFNNKSEITPVD